MAGSLSRHEGHSPAVCALPAMERETQSRLFAHRGGHFPESTPGSAVAPDAGPPVPGRLVCVLLATGCPFHAGTMVQPCPVEPVIGRAVQSLHTIRLADVERAAQEGDGF